MNKFLMTRFLITLGFLCIPLNAYAAEAVSTPTGELPATVKDVAPPLHLQGWGHLDWLFWDVYDAALWTQKESWDYGQAFALDIRYLRELSGDDIALRGIEEMREQGYQDDAKLQAWLDIQRAAFPDVKAGDHLTGVFLPPNETRFYFNGELTKVTHDREFAEAFFGIWLAEDTSAPDVRARLLGKANQ